MAAKAAPSCVLNELVEPVFDVLTCAVAVAPAESPVTVTVDPLRDIEPAFVETVQVYAAS